MPREPVIAPAEERLARAAMHIGTTRIVPMMYFFMIPCLF